MDIAGGASTARQALNAGVIDELTLDIAPVLLGSGERIFDDVATFGFEPVEVLHSPAEHPYPLPQRRPRLSSDRFSRCDVGRAQIFALRRALTCPITFSP